MMSDDLMTRRNLLRTGAAGVGLALLPVRPENASADDSVGGWIDAHVHVWTPDTQRYPLAPGFAAGDMRPPSFTPEQLSEHTRPHGVSRVVLIQMSYYGFDNSYMLEVMRAHPGVYSGVAVVDQQQQPRQRMRELARQGVRGFRIQPGGRKPDDWLRGEGMRTMWQCGADEGLAMCHLINPEFLPSVAQMCRQFPQTPVVIDHFARIGIDGAIRQDQLDQLCDLARFEHVAVKVSAFYALGNKQPPYRDLSAMIRRLLDVFGPERLMWASDCPFQVQGEHTYKASIDLIREGLDFLSDGDRQWILRRTAERLFF